VTASVVTGRRLEAPPGVVWRHLMFFEQVPHRPPMALRVLLPEPLRAEGASSALGAETRCVYRQGYLVKRVTRIEPERLYGFEIVEQALEIGGGIRLAGGAYTLASLPDGSTRVEVETRFVGRRNPRWLWRRVEIGVCHLFHLHLLEAIRIESTPPRPEFRTRPSADPPGAPPPPTS
jgi:hypothetical protein